VSQIANPRTCETAGLGAAAGGGGGEDKGQASGRICQKGFAFRLNTGVQNRSVIKKLVSSSRAAHTMHRAAHSASLLFGAGRRPQLGVRWQVGPWAQHPDVPIDQDERCTESSSPGSGAGVGDIEGGTGGEQQKGGTIRMVKCNGYGWNNQRS